MQISPQSLSQVYEPACHARSSRGSATTTIARLRLKERSPYSLPTTHRTTTPPPPWTLPPPPLHYTRCAKHSLRLDSLPSAESRVRGSPKVGGATHQHSRPLCSSAVLLFSLSPVATFARESERSPFHRKTTCKARFVRTRIVSNESFGYDRRSCNA